MSTTITKEQLAFSDWRFQLYWIEHHPSVATTGYRVVANACNISKPKDLKPSSDLILVYKKRD
jgi:hypothetical protein